MSGKIKIKSALVSVYHKDKLDGIVNKLISEGVEFYSTGGTQQFLEGLGAKVTAVEDLTTYPSILGGRVKTLHPKIFGGILARRGNTADQEHLQQYQIPEIDLVIVDLYPFEETLASGASEDDIIEKIDIGGISLIRAAAKNHKDVLIVASQAQYLQLQELLDSSGAETTLAQRREFAAQAFNVSSHYDSAIFSYFDPQGQMAFKSSVQESKVLRYGENPHQKGLYYGKLADVFEQISGREVSYNNLLDIDAAFNLIEEFSSTTVAILKHNNACGIASRDTVAQAWADALAADPVSAFGGVIVANSGIDAAAAEAIDKIFFEIIIAPSFSAEATEILSKKKNRIILVLKNGGLQKMQYRSLLNGALVQERDIKTETKAELETVTKSAPAEQELDDLVFANKIVKQSKSNAIVLVKNGQMIASGVGQTSRVDALKHAISKAESFGLPLQGAVMASDAFFPFADCVEIAHKAGISAVIQPGGSIKDKDSVEYCDNNGMSMVFSGIRHFKH
jgi:phosphoribosylaminoimidazolecarboxamide formyltransferase / IMP cyclohydrolase